MYLFKSLFYFNPSKFGDSVEDRLQRFEEINLALDLDGRTVHTEDSLGDGTNYVCFSRPLSTFGLEATSHVLMTFEENPRIFVAVTQDGDTPNHKVNQSLLLPALGDMRRQEPMSTGLGQEEFRLISDPEMHTEELTALLTVKERSAPLALISEHFQVEDKDLENSSQTTLITKRLTQKQLTAFNEFVGPSHSIPRKGLRIFSSTPNFSITRDAARHPVIFGEELTDWETVVWRKTRKAAFRDTKIFEAETKVLSAKILLERSRRAITKSETDSEDIDILKKSNLELQERVATLSREVAQLEQAIQEQQLELLNGSDLYSKLFRKHQYLENKFRENGFFEIPVDKDESGLWDEVPNSFAEIVERIPDTNHLVFTGSLEGVNWCDEQADILPPLIKCRDVLRAMEAYASVKRQDLPAKFSGSFFDYLKDTKGSDFKVSPQVISMKESEQVRNNPKLREQRVFKVPAEVSIHETEFMEAHAKLRVVGGSAIRMHFFDDTTNTGKIFIGYIGKHLPLPK